MSSHVLHGRRAGRGGGNHINNALPGVGGLGGVSSPSSSLLGAPSLGGLNAGGGRQGGATKKPASSASSFNTFMMQQRQSLASGGAAGDVVVDEGLDEDIVDTDNDALKAPPPSVSTQQRQQIGRAANVADVERAIASHVLIATRNEAEELLQRLQGAKDLKVLLAEEAYDRSTCPSGKANGGNIGWFGAGETAPQFEKAVFAPTVKLGVPLGPVQTSHGFHVVVVHAFHPPRGEKRAQALVEASKQRDSAADEDAGTGFGVALAGHRRVTYEDDGDNPLMQQKESKVTAASEPRTGFDVTSLPAPTPLRPEERMDVVMPRQSSQDDRASPPATFASHTEEDDQPQDRVKTDVSRAMSGTLGGLVDEDSDSEPDEVPELDEPVDEISDEEIERFDVPADEDEHPAWARLS